MAGANETTTWAPEELQRIGKYDRHGPRIVGSVVGPSAHRVTVRLVPQPEEV